jgi:ketosteroid isomerase-like protein
MRALPLLVLAACTSVRHEDADQVREAIGEAWTEHLAAVKRKDAAGVGRLYADDVVSIVPDECEVRGRKAIDEMEAKGLGSVEILDVEHTTEALRVYGDIAYEIGVVVGPVRPHGQPAKVVTFRYMARWKRQPEEYVGWHRLSPRWRIQYIVGEPER